MSTSSSENGAWSVELDFFPTRRKFECLVGIVGAVVAWATNAPSIIYILIGAVLLSINLVYRSRMSSAADYRFSDHEVTRGNLALRWADVKSSIHDTRFGVLTLIPKEGAHLAIPIAVFKESDQLLKRIQQQLDKRIEEDRSGEILEDVFD